MCITKFETWWVERGERIFDEKREGGSAMPWDVIVLRLTCDDGNTGLATAMAARSGQVTEGYLQDLAAPLVLGRDPRDHEAIWYEFWNLDRHEAFFPVFLPGPVDVALWDLCAKAVNLPLYKYIGAYRESLPVYASSIFYDAPQRYIDEALKYKAGGISCYKVHPSGPAEFDMEVHQKLRDAVGPDMGLITDPVGEYTLDEAVRIGRHLEHLGYIWFEEPFRDFELYKYRSLCDTLDIPIAATETTRGGHWGVAQVLAQRAADIVRADVSWKCGITGTLKIAHLADSFGINCEVHTTTMNYLDMVNLHVSCAIRNCKYFEYFVPESRFRFPMKGDLPIRNGRIHVPQSPGIGAELDWDIIDNNCKSYRIKTWEPRSQRTSKGVSL